MGPYAEDRAQSLSATLLESQLSEVACLIIFLSGRSDVTIWSIKATSGAGLGTRIQARGFLLGITMRVA